MSKFLFFFFMAVLFFLGGMYRYMPLLVLSSAMILLAVFCLITSRYFRRHLTVEFSKHSETGRVRDEISCGLTIRYTGIWPTGAVRIPLRISWGDRGKHRLCAVRQAVEKKGDLPAAFSVKASCCGLASISFERFKACDYLSLFRPGKKQADCMELAVFPGEEALQLAFSSAGEAQDVQLETPQQNLSGDTSQEIRQLREYREGDLVRHIHWNLSARMDEIYVREFQHENDSFAGVLLDGRGFSALSEADAGCFYELTSAVILGLLKQVTVVVLGWRGEGREDLILEEIRNADQCREALLSLYRNSPVDKLPVAVEDQAGLLLVDPKLRISLNGQILHKFSRKNLEEEISRDVVLI